MKVSRRDVKSGKAFIFNLSAFCQLFPNCKFAEGVGVWREVVLGLGLGQVSGQVGRWNGGKSGQGEAESAAATDS